MVIQSGGIAAFLMVGILSLLGNTLVFSTLLRRSLLHHPSNRLVLSLAFCNIILVVAGLPLMLSSHALLASHAGRKPDLNDTFFDEVTDLEGTEPKRPSVQNEVGAALYDVSGDGKTQIQLFQEKSEKNINFQEKKDSSVGRDGKYLKSFYLFPKKSQLGEKGPRSDPREYAFIERKSEDDAVAAISSSTSSYVPYFRSGRDTSASKGRHVDALILTSVPRTTQTLCNVTGFIFNFLLVVSSLSVAVIAIDRYLDIGFPMMHGTLFTTQRANLLLSWCWTQAFITALPPLFGWSRYSLSRGRWCGVDWGFSLSYSVVWLTSAFLLPVLVMVACYAFILQVAKNKCQRVHVGTLLEASSNGGTVSPLQTSSLYPCEFGCIQQTSSAPAEDDNQRLSPSRRIKKHSAPAGPVNYESNSTSGSRLTVCHPLDSKSCLHFQRCASATEMTPPSRPNVSLWRPSILVSPLRKASWVWEGPPFKGLRTVFVVVGAQLVTWAPFSVYVLAGIFLSNENQRSLFPESMETCFLVVLCFSGVLHPIVYGLYNRSIRKELRSFWRRKRKRRDGFRMSSQRLIPRKISMPENLLVGAARHYAGTLTPTGRECPAKPSSSPEVKRHFQTSLGVYPPGSPLTNKSTLRKPSQDSGAVMPSGDDLYLGHSSEGIVESRLWLYKRLLAEDTSCPDTEEEEKFNTRSHSLNDVCEGRPPACEDPQWGPFKKCRSLTCLSDMTDLEEEHLLRSLRAAPARVSSRSPRIIVNRCSELVEEVERILGGEDCGEGRTLGGIREDEESDTPGLRMTSRSLLPGMTRRPRHMSEDEGINCDFRNPVEEV